MKTLLVSFLIFLSPSKDILLCQEQLKPFNLSPFIGEKLDRVEESYFKLFPGVTSFNEATFYLDADSSLFINVKFYENNILKDTLFVSIRSAQYLQDKISEIILKNIKEGRVEELEFITNNKEKYKGTVYSFDSKEIKLIENEFAQLNSVKRQEDYISFISYSQIEKMKIYKSNTVVSLLLRSSGVVGGWFIGGALAPEPEGFLDFSKWVGRLLGAFFGYFIGYAIGTIVKFPEEYDTIDSEAVRIIKENSLLPSGL